MSADAPDRTGEPASREDLLLAELAVLSRHLADAGVTIERLREHLVHLEELHARSLRGRLRRLVDRILGIPAPRPLSADLPPAPPGDPTPPGYPAPPGDPAPDDSPLDDAPPKASSS